MNKLILSLLFSVSLFGAQLHWVHNYDKGLALAKKEHKDVYLMIGADACRFCKKFKETTLKDTKVINALNAAFVTVYLSRDRHFIPDKFERYGAPRHYFLKPSGEIYDEDAGYIAPERFLSLIKEVRFFE